MENLCILSDFPSKEEEKYYKLIESSVSDIYAVYIGGNYVCIKNKRGKTVRFTSKELNKELMKEEDIKAWIEKLQKLVHPF